MDDYLEQLLEKERKKNVFGDFTQTNEAWKDFVQQQNYQVEEVIDEHWEKEKEDMKQLNQENKEHAKEQVVVHQIEDIKLADEELIKQ